MIFMGNSTWSWCYALWSSLAIPHDLNATLYDLQLPLHTSASDSLGWGGVGWDPKNMVRSKKYGLLLQRCNHSQGNFCRTRTLKNRGKVKIHTGHVDGFWKVLKEAIPGSLPSKKGQARNPQIWKCMCSFQWRWECTGKNLMETTADTLKKILEKVAVALFQAEVMEGLLFTK